MPIGISRANQNRKLRQEALREQLATGGHVEHVLEMANKIADLDNTLESADIHRLKTACDIKMKIVNKYLGDTKEIDNNIDLAGELAHEHRVILATASNKT